jgi:hypothetical protein
MRSFTLLLLVGIYYYPQDISAPPTLSITELAKAAKAYLRDSAEFPMNMRITTVVIDAQGRAIKRDKGTGHYDFHGYNARAGNANASMRISTKGIFHSPKGLLPAAWNSFIASMLPANVLSPDASEHYSLETVVTSDGAELVAAKISPVPACTEFKWAPDDTAPETLCGSGQFHLQKDQLLLKHFSFDAGGLPITTKVKPFGQCGLMHYHVEAEFQQVTLSGDPKPFLVPKQVDITVETDKGKLLMSTQFEPAK